jgi:pectin methylesterase-like acyl-CoA thioesterase
MKTILLITLLTASLPAFNALGAEPAATAKETHRGVILHVSKLGDNSDGRRWNTAFHTIQKALDAVPDNQGGHRIIIIRPDTYAEANLYPAHPGAAGAVFNDCKLPKWPA